MPHPFIPTPLTAQSVMRYLQNGQEVENVYHFVGTSAWDSVLLGALSNYLHDWEVAQGSVHRNQTTTLHEVVSTDLSAHDGAWDVSDYDVNGLRTSAQPLPNNVTFAIKAATAKRGRSFRGRTYWIGLDYGMLGGTADVLATSQISAIVASLDAMLTGAIPNGGKGVVLSLRSGGAWRTTGVTTLITNYAATDSNLDSQRRRLPGHNIHR